MCPFYYRSQKICSILNATGSVKRPSESGNRRIIYFYCTKMTFLDRQRNFIFAPFGAGKTTSSVIWPESDSAGRTRRAQPWPRTLGVIAKSWFPCFAPSRKVVATLTIPWGKLNSGKTCPTNAIFKIDLEGIWCTQIDFHGKSFSFRCSDVEFLWTKTNTARIDFELV